MWGRLAAVNSDGTAVRDDDCCVSSVDSLLTTVVERAYGMPRSTPTSDRYAVMKHKPSHHCGYIVQDGQPKTFALASCGKQNKRICFSVMSYNSMPCIFISCTQFHCLLYGSSSSISRPDFSSHSCSRYVYTVLTVSARQPRATRSVPGSSSYACYFVFLRRFATLSLFTPP